MDLSSGMIANLIVWYIVFVFSTTCHEAAHAFVAYKGGDSTAYEGGHVSLDPIPHIKRSPFGMVLVPLISFVQMGWMIGWASVPYDPEWGQRHPRRQALMSLAGPAANLLLALVALVIMRVLLAQGVFVAPNQVSFTHLVVLAKDPGSHTPLAAAAMALSIMMNLNVLLGLFNLIPIPPLDGAGVVEGAAPHATASIYGQLRSSTFMQIAGLIVAWQLFPYVARPAFSLVLMLVHPAVHYQ